MNYKSKIKIGIWLRFARINPAENKIDISDEQTVYLIWNYSMNEPPWS